MKSNEIIKKFEEEICPRCEHYKDKNYKECSVTITIEGEAKCINCKCISYERINRESDKREF